MVHERDFFPFIRYENKVKLRLIVEEVRFAYFRISGRINLTVKIEVIFFATYFLNQ